MLQMVVRAVLVAILCVVSAFGESPSLPSHDSSDTTGSVDAAFLVDLSTGDRHSLLLQVIRARDVIRSLASIKDVHTRFAVSAFHSSLTPVIEFDRSFATDADKVTEILMSLRPRVQTTSISVSTALMQSLDQFNASSSTSHKALFLLSDGKTTDTVDETLRALHAISSRDVRLFVIASPTADEVPLLGYVEEFRNRLFSQAHDKAPFLHSVRKFAQSHLKRQGKKTQLRALGARNLKTSTDSDRCPDKIDLMLVLDTSGSIFSIFEEQRNIAEGLVDAINTEKFGGRIRLSLIRFSTDSQLVIRMRNKLRKTEVVDRIRLTTFSGSNTRVVEGIEAAIAELKKTKSKGAAQILVLISNGHGQDKWDEAQATSKHLRAIQNPETGDGVQVYAVGQKHNQEYINVYVKEAERIFQGDQYSNFVPTLAGYINTCLGLNGNDTSAESTNNSTRSSESGEGLNEQEILLGAGTDPFTGDGSGEEFTTAPTTTHKLHLHSSESNETKEHTTPESKDHFSSSAESENTTFKSSELFDRDNVASFLNHLNLEKKKQHSAPFKRNGIGSAELREKGGCDVMFVIDRSQSVEKDFENEIALAARSLDHIREESFSSGRVHIGVVSFASSATLDKPLAIARKEEVVKTIRGLAHTGGKASVVTGFERTLQELSMSRREDSHLLILLVSDGHSEDVWKRVQETSRKVHALPQSSLIALTVTPHHSIAELKHWTNENTENLYSAHHPTDWLKRVGIELKKCDLGISETTQEPLFDLSPSESTTPDSVSEESGTTDTVSVTPTPTTTVPTTTIPISTTTKRATTSAKPTSTTPTTTATTKKPSTTKKPKTTTTTTTTVPSTTNTEPATTIEETSTTETDDMTTTTESTFELIPLAKMVRPLSQTKSEETTTTEEPTTTATKATTKAKKPTASTATTTNAPTTKTTTPTAKKTTTTISFSSDDDSTNFTHSSTARSRSLPPIQLITADRLNKPLLTGPCPVDLIFVVDVSQSVEEAFQRQMQFALQLLALLPDHHFEHKLRVCIVKFNHESSIVLPLTVQRSKDKLLAALSRLTHEGGSTSVASGMNLAVDEFIRNRRPDARSIAVLMSDGNSQDLWADVVHASERARKQNVDVFAVTASKEYMFRELEIYAGNKWAVYIDARIHAFLDDASRVISDGCSNSTIVSSSSTAAPPIFPSSTTSTLTTKKALPKECTDDRVDLMILLDTSTKDEEEMVKERKLLTDLLEQLPEEHFEDRINTGLIHFSTRPTLAGSLGTIPTRSDLLYEISRVAASGTIKASLVTAADIAVREFVSQGRKNARRVIVLISDGESNDREEEMKRRSDALDGEHILVFAASANRTANGKELKAYARDPDRVFVRDSKNFIKSVFDELVCSGVHGDNLVVKRSSTASPHAFTSSLIIQMRDFAPPKEQFVFQNDEKTITSNNCRKMDIEIILDASTSREEVFEHQRELALSLIERLPISKESDAVAVGIISFTSQPALRHPMSTGKSKKELRKAIESIDYNGGSTLTAQAVRLGIQDLTRARRAGAVQVFVLMNDGRSQDYWETVVDVSSELEQTKSERFAVALGPEIDIRELSLYSPKKIYRDGSTEEFLSDVVSLLGSEACFSQQHVQPALDEPTGTELPLFLSSTTPTRAPTTSNNCDVPGLDMVFVLDKTSDDALDLSSNRYMLLDLLGSLMSNPLVRIAVISFAQSPKLDVEFTSTVNKQQIFQSVERIVTVQEDANYAAAMEKALDVLQKGGRADAQGAIVLIGDGRGVEDAKDRRRLALKVKETPSLSCFAVDSSPNTNIRNLAQYANGRENVFDFDRNSLFVERIEQLANDTTACTSSSRSPNTSNLNKKFRDLAVVAQESIVHNNEKFVFTKPNFRRPFTTPLAPWNPSTTPSGPGIKIADYFRGTRRFSSGGSRAFSAVHYTPTAPLYPPTAAPDFFTTTTTGIPTTSTIEFRPGCVVDALIILDSSGSVLETFKREKELAKNILRKFRIGKDNARVALVRFASKDKVKTVWSFKDNQTEEAIHAAFDSIPFTSGTSALHAALIQAATEFSENSRPGVATPMVIVFTDGFGEKDIEHEAKLLRAGVKYIYAVAINHKYAINRSDLTELTGSPDKVFTDENIGDLHALIDQHARGCKELDEAA